MEGLLFPIIMLLITLFGGSVLIFIIQYQRPKVEEDKIAMELKTAQEFINVKDIRDQYLYTNDGMLLMFLRLPAISIDLYSMIEKKNLMKQLTAELSDIQYPFKFLAVSRPIDISSLILDMQSMLKTADDVRKELLRQEILEMSGYALSGEIVERQFYISIWERYEEGIEREISRRASLLAEKFSINGIHCESLKEKEIIRLMNIINNPSYIHLEDTEFRASIPTLYECGKTSELGV